MIEFSIRNKFQFSVFIFTLSLLISCSSNSTDKGNNNSRSTANEWYVGGTLHQASVSEWKNATSENKLATCADIVANIKKFNNQSYNGDLISMKEDAMQMMDCIDETVKGNTAKDANVKINEIAAMCAILLNNNK